MTMGNPTIPALGKQTAGRWFRLLTDTWELGLAWMRLRPKMSEVVRNAGGEGRFSRLTGRLTLTASFQRDGSDLFERRHTCEHFFDPVLD